MKEKLNYENTTPEAELCRLGIVFMPGVGRSQGGGSGGYRPGCKPGPKPSSGKPPRIRNKKAKAAAVAAAAAAVVQRQREYSVSTV